MRTKRYYKPFKKKRKKGRYFETLQIPELNKPFDDVMAKTLTDSVVSMLMCSDT